MATTEAVHTIESLGIGRAYLYQEQDRLTLIDTGLTDSTERILAVVGKIGRKPEDVRRIFITHHHNDHTGSLADLVERTGAQASSTIEKQPWRVRIGSASGRSCAPIYWPVKNWRASRRYPRVSRYEATSSNSW